ncbi:hypothetical protein EsDP_00002231 [Epichloe bromicola]|uniref:Uncharacterized protein n=1 Tax=Epichloe bromicola TaxID=79588 RepID=A0ABQ0CKP3_9HYPO
MIPRPPTPPRASQRPPSDIPVLTSVTPAMYVPTPPDFFAQTFEAPTTREAHLAASLATLDAHASAVKANILSLTRRECIRIAREAPASQQADSPERKGLHPDDRRSMIANMEAPRGSAAGRELPAVPDFDTWPAFGPEGATDIRMMATVSRTMIEMSGYERHVGLVKAGYAEALEKERGKERGKGGKTVEMDIDVRLPAETDMMMGERRS